MTKDLAICIHGSSAPENSWLTTEDFMDAIDQNFKMALN